MQFSPKILQIPNGKSRPEEQLTLRMDLNPLCVRQGLLLSGLGAFPQHLRLVVWFPPPRLWLTLQISGSLR